MFLEQLNIKKFRGVENQTFTFEKNLTAFGGKNGIGKSTIVDTIMWLLCDETNVYGKENSLNIDKNNPKEPLEVSGVFRKNDGTKIELKRIYKASYTKDGEFSKFSNDFFINEAKYSTTEYFKRLNQEIGLQEETLKGFNTLRCLIDFNYLGSIDYKIARTKIEKILNLSSDKDLVNDPQYALIKDDLMAQLYDVSKVKTMLNRKKTSLQDELQNNEASLAELKNQLKPVDEEKIKELEDKIDKISSKNYNHSIEYNSAKEKLANSSNSIAAIAKQLDEEIQKERVISAQKNNLINSLNPKKEQLEKYKNEFVKVKASIQKCPNCGFSSNLEEVKNKLQDIKVKAEELAKVIQEADNNIKQFTTDEVDNAIAQLKEKYNKAINERSDLEKDFNSLLEKEELDSKEFYLKKTQLLQQLSSELAGLKAAKDNSMIASKENYIQTLKQQLSQIEIKLVLLEDFKQDKINKIQQKTNEVFPDIEFVLLETSNTGAITETCKATYKGVDYHGLNDGQKIKLGIEIIEDLRKALGVKETLPIIFDKLKDLDSENIKSLVANTQAQIFSTFVANEDTIKLLEL